MDYFFVYNSIELGFICFPGDDHKASGRATGCEEEEESSAYCQWGNPQQGEK